MKYLAVVLLFAVIGAGASWGDTIGTEKLSTTAPLSVTLNTVTPAAGDALTVDVAVQPLALMFDAWGCILGPGPVVYSFTPGDPTALRSGIAPLVTNIPGLPAPYTTRLLDLTIPPGVAGEYTIVVELTPTGLNPFFPIEGYKSVKSVSIPELASTHMRDNIFIFTLYPSLHSTSFASSGDHSITGGQPWGGITGSSSDGNYTIDVRAGRKGSTGPAEWFKDRTSVAFCTQIYGLDNWPHDLNFAFTGTLWIDGNGYNMVIGQGHSPVSGNNNWWYGGEGFSRGADGLTTPDNKYFICPIDSTTINELYIQPN